MTDDRVNLTDRWHQRRAELDAVAVQLRATRQRRLEALVACEQFVERLAANGDVAAGAVADMAAATRRDMDIANVEGLMVLPTVPEPPSRPL